MTEAGQLLREIESIGGCVTVLPTDQLLCEWIPREYESRLTALKNEIINLLQAHQPATKLDKKQLKKLIKTIQDAGGEFHLSPSRLFFDFIKLPDELVHLEDTVLDNAMAIFEILRPKAPARSKPKKVCSFCASGTGCRQKYKHEFSYCGACGHDCGYHYESCVIPGMERPGGCRKVLWDDEDQQFTCKCSGWPPAPPKPPRKTRGKTQQLTIAPQPE